jgi:hypothetical protein
MSLHFDRNAGKFMLYLHTKINMFGFEVSKHDGSSRQGTVSPPPKPNSEGPTLVGCPRLFQRTRGYPPCLEPATHIQMKD